MDIWMARLFISFRYKTVSSVTCHLRVGSGKVVFFIRI
jgi:hypothetical protein